MRSDKSPGHHTHYDMAKPWTDSGKPLEHDRSKTSVLAASRSTHDMHIEDYSDQPLMYNKTEEEGKEDDKQEKVDEDDGREEKEVSKRMISKKMDRRRRMMSERMIKEIKRRKGSKYCATRYWLS